VRGSLWALHPILGAESDVKPLDSWGSDSNLTEGAYSALPDALAGGEGLIAALLKTHPHLCPAGPNIWPFEPHVCMKPV